MSETAQPEDFDCLDCGAPAGERCRRLIPDGSNASWRRRTASDPPAGPATFPHENRRRAAAAAALETAKEGEG